jgi:hypothetical protein
VLSIVLCAGDIHKARKKTDRILAFLEFNILAQRTGQTSSIWTVLESGSAGGKDGDWIKHGGELIGDCNFIQEGQGGPDGEVSIQLKVLMRGRTESWSISRRRVCSDPQSVGEGDEVSERKHREGRQARVLCLEMESHC